MTIPKPNRHPTFANGIGAICPACGTGIVAKLKTSLPVEGTRHEYSKRETDAAYEEHYREKHGNA